MTITPAAAAKRQWLRDRYAELLTTWGAPDADTRAGLLLDEALRLGWMPPHADGDDDTVIAPRYVRAADPAHVATVKAGIRAVLAQPTGTRAATCALCLQLTERHHAGACPPPL